MIERYLLLVLALGSNMILARLLTANQIGVFSVSLAVIGVAQALRDFGIGSFLIQETHLNDRQISTAFGISLVMGILLFAIFMIGASQVAAFYNEQRMASTIRISALNFLLLPFCTISLALLRRAMEFRLILYITVIAAFSGAIVSITAALLGYGENSLAVGSVVLNLVTGFGAWRVRSDRKLIRPGLSEWRAIARFGGQSSLAGFVTSISMDANDLVVGKILGFQPVAIISRAQGLMNLFNRDLMAAVRNVALPAFAAAHRAGSPLQAAFARSLGMVSVFAWTFYALTAIYSLEILDLLYGAQWHGAAPLVPIFCLSGAISAANSLTPNLLIAVGRNDLVTIVELSLQPMRLLFVFLAAITFQSVEACCYAFLLSSAIAFPVFWWLKNLVLPDHSGNIRRNFAKSLIITIVMILPPMVQIGFVGLARDVPLAPWYWLPVVCFSVCLGVAAIGIIRHPLAEERIYQESKVRLLRYIRRDI